MRFQSYFNHALTLTGGYDGRMPLSHYLKKYFAENSKHGSTDRKMIAHLCYSFYRLGHSLKDHPPAERMKIALFLCADDLTKWSALFDGEGLMEPAAEAAMEPDPTISDLNSRIARVQQQYPSFAIEDIFPWKDQLSDGIDHYSFCLSFLRQPDLFLRIRPGHEKEVLQKLATKSPPLQFHQFIPPFTLRLPNGFKTEEFFTPDKEIVIQDYSSQRLASFLRLPEIDSSASPRRSIWDACAASGGKSILAHDLDPKIDITVSDIRASILHNLDRRFRVAGIKNYHSFVADLTLSAPLPGIPNPFGLILADAPCTGSGTWSRTPEELYFFDPAKIDAYRATQEKILSRLIPHLGKRAFLVYSTCSVFKKENEEMTAFIRDSLGLRLERMETITGIDDRADTMFAALFTS
ncbi:MAG TPA: Fmu (Sun) domain-containing protein [Puia sp.]|jgi:16S rRNA (cytosine967-C5)-methyltransferase